MKAVPQILIRTRRNAWPALSGLALGCSLAYYIASRRRHKAPTLEVVVDPAASDGKQPSTAPAEPDNLDDDLIVELVTSEIDRSCSTPGQIQVLCTRGVVNLAGPVLKTEIHKVLRAVSRIPGIVEIHDHLEARRQPMAVSREGTRRTRRPAGRPASRLGAESGLVPS